MDLTIERYPDPGGFLDRVGAMLLHREAENNLVLGVVGRLVARPDPAAAHPYLAAVQLEDRVVACVMRTPPFGAVLTRMPLEALDPVASNIAAVYKEIPSVLAPQPTADAFAVVWTRLTGARSRVGMRQRIYQLDRVEPLKRPPTGRCRQASDGDFDLLVEWIGAFNADLGGVPHDDAEPLARRCLHDGCAFFWEDPDPVSMALWTGPTPNGVRITGVYTPPDARRRGYASACVADLSQHMLDEGRSFCFLYTDLANPTSNNIYKEIGYRPVCDTTFYHFETAGPGPRRDG